MIDLEKEMQEISLELNTQQMSQSAIKRRKEELDNRHKQLSMQRQQLEEELRNAEDDADRLQDEQVDLESANEQDEEGSRRSVSYLNILETCRTACNGSFQGSYAVKQRITEVRISGE